MVCVRLLRRAALVALFVAGFPALAQKPPANGVGIEIRDVQSRGMWWSKPGLLRERYEGEWKDGQRNGRGVLIWAGNRYEGDFRNGHRTGHGVLLRADGLRYDGEWLDDRIQGNGVLTWPDGQRYEGPFEKDAFHGRGVVSYLNGNRCVVDYAFRSGTAEPNHAVCQLANGDRYEGDVADYGSLTLIASGVGVLTRSDGRQHGGRWFEGCREPGTCAMRPFYRTGER